MRERSTVYGTEVNGAKIIMYFFLIFKTDGNFFMTVSRRYTYSCKIVNKKKVTVAPSPSVRPSVIPSRASDFIENRKP